MTYNANSFDCAAEIMHYINSGIELYRQLEDNYIEILGDYENANRCFYKRQALTNVSDDIDAIVHHGVSVLGLDATTLINCPSFIWSLRRRVGKHIDYVNSWGYDYVMRDSEMLRYQLEMYQDIYEYIIAICKKHNVYC